MQKLSVTDFLYSEWASGGDPSQQLIWSHGSSGGVAYHTFNLTTQQVFTEIDQQAAWGTWFFSTSDDDGVCDLISLWLSEIQYVLINLCS